MKKQNEAMKVANFVERDSFAIAGILCPASHYLQSIGMLLIKMH